MSIGTATEHAAHDELANAPRHPVRVDVDGDVALADLLALAPHGPAVTITAAAAASAGLWRIGTADATEVVFAVRSAVVDDTPTREDEVVLRGFETSGVFLPPVAARVAGLSPALGAAWLALAARWTALAQSTGDLRFLNTACKLVGAVWIHHCQSSTGGDPAWRTPALTGQLSALGQALASALEDVGQRLEHRVLPAGSARPDEDVLRPAPSARGAAGARVVVLAAAGSRSAGRLVAAAVDAEVPISSVCWYAPPTTGAAVASNYNTAWYPPADADPAIPSPLPGGIPVTTAADWDTVVSALRAVDADLVLLVGMPIVPARVLDAANLGTLNAHNGALPTYRGMDAVGWALLNDDPVVCSLHLARPAVDTGAITATVPVPTIPVRTLAARVKSTQLRLLLAGASQVVATGTLPDLHPQATTGTQYYRLHPLLKRLLDTSPYARDDHPEWTVTQP